MTDATAVQIGPLVLARILAGEADAERGLDRLSDEHRAVADQLLAVEVAQRRPLWSTLWPMLKDGDALRIAVADSDPKLDPLAPPAERRNGQQASATVTGPSTSGRQQPSIVSARTLATMEFPEPKVIVDGLLLEGGVLVAAPGKSGKSRMMMNVAVAVASGGKALGTIDVEQGDVLYLCLEDGLRRAKNRMLEAARGTAPERLDLAVKWPTLDAGGLALLDGWLQEHPNARLVVVDTLKRIRPRGDARRNIYDLDYESVAPLNDLAQQHRVCIAMVVHTNKLRAAEDPTDRITGSTGQLAAVDGAIVLERVRGRADANLGVYHRDLEDAQYAIQNDPEQGWLWLGDAAQYGRSEIQQQILDVIQQAGRPLQPAEVATTLGAKRETIGQRMWQMANRRDGEVNSLITSGNGRYVLPRMPPPPEPDTEWELEGGDGQVRTALPPEEDLSWEEEDGDVLARTPLPPEEYLPPELDLDWAEEDEP